MLDEEQKQILQREYDILEKQKAFYRLEHNIPIEEKNKMRS